MTEMLNQDSKPENDQGPTREAWLHRAIEAFRPRFAEIGLPLPGKLHVSVGFGCSSRAESKHILGQCWAGAPAPMALTTSSSALRKATGLASSSRRQSDTPPPCSVAPLTCCDRPRSSTGVPARLPGLSLSWSLSPRPELPARRLRHAVAARRRDPRRRLSFRRRQPRRFRGEHGIAPGARLRVRERSHD